MYLTAQHVRSRDGTEEVHAFLHVHDASAPFPYDAPLSVVDQRPGRLVLRSTKAIQPGGNRVTAFLDIIVPDELWSERWAASVSHIKNTMYGRPLPWVCTLGPAHVVFNADPQVSSAAEYDALRDAAIGLWRSWASAHP